MKRDVIYVIGHKNPDTDSICSAIAYAELCRLQGKHQVCPARAGNLNRQTEFVLETLGQEPPELVADVYPRVRDVVEGEPVTISEQAPLAEALQIMRRRDIRMLPVVDPEQKPVGALVLKRLPEHVFLPGEGKHIRQVLTSLQSIQSCLKAEVLTMQEAARVDMLELYVGAMASQTFVNILVGSTPGSAVVLTGDRIKIQKAAVALGVRLLIVTGGLPVSEEVKKAAIEKGVSILISPYDTATSALLTRLSTPVGRLADTDLPKVSPEDRLTSLSRVLSRGGAPGAVVLDEDGRVCGVATKTNLLRRSSIRLILVDHNELSQAVPGADQVDILEVIDHHRLGNFHTEVPIRFINQPLGSTCSLVASLYRQAGLTPAPKTAGLMLAGLLSDTVLLKSPTTTDLDRELAGWLAQQSGLEPEVFGQIMFRSGSALADYPDTQALLLADFKEYGAGRRQLGIGQVEVVSFNEFHDRLEELGQGLAALREARGLDFAGLLVSDIVEQNSQLLVNGESDLVDAIGYPRLEKSLFELKGVLSRKKQLVPHLLRAFRDRQAD
jgi:manganese-dependent inorganic pyrophosphatase